MIITDFLVLECPFFQRPLCSVSTDIVETQQNIPVYCEHCKQVHVFWAVVDEDDRLDGVYSFQIQYQEGN